MFDLAWSEILLIAVVAVVFIGPKELPAALRTFGKWTQKARLMASEFQRNLDDMVREAELEDVKKQFDEVRSIATNPTGAIEKWVDPKGEIRGAFTPPEAGTTPGTTPGTTYDKPGVEKPVDKSLAASDKSLATPLDQPAAAVPAPTPAPAAPQPVAAPMPAVPVTEPAPPPAQAASPQSPAPPVVAPPPSGAGAAAEPSQPSAGAKAPAIAP